MSINNNNNKNYRTRFFTSLLIAVLAISAGAMLATAYSTNTSILVPTNYLTFQPPVKGGSYTDAVFGTAIKRISDSMHTTSASSGGMATTISHEYSTMSPFNIDNTRLLLGHLSYFALYDGSGNFLKNLWPSPGILGSAEPRWSKTDPNVLYYVSGNRLMKYNIGTDVAATIHTFSEYSAISGKGESDISHDGNHFVFSGDSRYVFVYEISSDTKGPVLDAGSGKFDDLYITPNNNVIVGYYATGSSRFNGMELYDRNMNFLRQITHVLGHQDVTMDGGEEVLIWANGADPNPQVSCNAGIVKVRLSDAKQTCVWTQTTWNSAYHISAPDNSGWFFVETYNPVDVIPPAGWDAQTNEILQVKLDGSEVRRLLHHRSRPLNGYTYQPKVSVSHDGTKLVFASNFGLQKQLAYPTEYSDEYLVDLSVASPGTGSTGGAPPPPSGSPGGTPPSGSTGGSTPASTPETVTRVEQNGAGAVYTGNWLANKGTFNSGSSAVMAASAGAKVNFAFNGTGVKWIGYRDEWSGIAKVYVDGAAAGTIDTYSTPGKAQTVMYSVSSLASGSHTLTIEVTGTKSASSAGVWVWVDAFDVTSGGTSASTGGATGGSTPIGSTPTPTTGRVEQNGAGVTYTGAWFANKGTFNSGGSAAMTASPGARANFAFNGTAVRWVGYRDEWSGIANVYIDGGLAGTVDTYASPGKAQVVVYSVSNLAPANHTLTIEATGTKGASSQGAWIWVDAFDTASGGTVSPVIPPPVNPPTPAYPGSSASTGSTPTACSTTPRRVEQNAAGVTYTGNWLANNGAFNSGSSAVMSAAAGSRATFSFTGCAVAWIGYRDQWAGVANVYVDGALKASVDTYASSGVPKVVMYSVKGLSNGPHTVTVEASGQKNASSAGAWVWVDAFDL